VQVVPEEQLTETAAVAPKRAVVDPTTKFVPLTVTTLPPATGPALGLRPVIVGTAYTGPPPAAGGTAAAA
jgi:hypothetical protein